MKKLNDSNVDHIVKKGDTFYFVTKDDPNKPLDEYSKLA